MPKISEIINASFKSGISTKTGKPWVMMQIKADDGNIATIFAPAVVGDEITMTYNDQYKNWNAEKVTPKSKFEAEVVEKLDKIIGLLTQTAIPVEAEKKIQAEMAEQVPVEAYGDIPF